MKKKLFGAIFVLAITVAAGYGVNKSVQHDADLSEMVLSNVEALADGENGYLKCCWANCETWQGWEAVCIQTGVGYDCTCGEVKPYY